MTRLNFLLFTPAPVDAGEPQASPLAPVNVGGDGKKSPDEGVVRAGQAPLAPSAARGHGRVGLGHRYRKLSAGRAAALSLGVAIGGSGLAVGLTQAVVWAATGTFPSFSLGQFVSYLVGIPALPSPSAAQPWYHPGVVLYWFSTAAPASLCLFLLGAWITLRARPEPGALPPVDAAEAVRQIEARRGKLLVVVSRQRPGLAEYLEEYFANDRRVEVRTDTRWGSGRARLAPQIQSLERRSEARGGEPAESDLRSAPFLIFERD